MGGQENSDSLQGSQTSQGDRQTSSDLENSPSARLVYLVVRRLEKGQTTQTGEDHAKVNKLPTSGALTECPAEHRDLKKLTASCESQTLIVQS